MLAGRGEPGDVGVRRMGGVKSCMISFQSHDFPEADVSL